jgi:hypothetical protein
MLIGARRGAWSARRRWSALHLGRAMGTEAYSVCRRVVEAPGAPTWSTSQHGARSLAVPPLVQQAKNATGTLEEQSTSLLGQLGPSGLDGLHQLIDLLLGLGVKADQLVAQLGVDVAFRGTADNRRWIRTRAFRWRSTGVP